MSYEITTCKIYSILYIKKFDIKQHILYIMQSTAAFTYYYDPAILQNKLTPLTVFRDLALRKRDSKMFMFYFYVFFLVYSNIPKLFGLVVYSGFSGR